MVLAPGGWWRCRQRVMCEGNRRLHASMYICVMCVRSGLYGSGAMSGPERGARRKLRAPQKNRATSTSPRRHNSRSSASTHNHTSRTALAAICSSFAISAPHSCPSHRRPYQKLVCGRLYPLCRSAMCWLKFSPTWPSEL